MIGVNSNTTCLIDHVRDLKAKTNRTHLLVDNMTRLFTKVTPTQPVKQIQIEWF